MHVHVLNAYVVQHTCACLQCKIMHTVRICVDLYIHTYVHALCTYVCTYNSVDARIEVEKLGERFRFKLAIAIHHSTAKVPCKGDERTVVVQLLGQTKLTAINAHQLIPRGHGLPTSEVKDHGVDLYMSTELRTVQTYIPQHI